MTSNPKDHIPKVSIGMPVYNGEKYIREALDSLLAQTFTDFELIISDNASTDGTEAICEEYVRRDERIRYVRQTENQGPTWNFNFVLKEANGKYFMWAAHDDRWLSGFIERLILLLQSDDRCALAFSHYRVRNLENRMEKTVRVIPSWADSAGLNYLVRLINACPSLIYGLFKSDILKGLNVQGFDFADVNLTLELAAKWRIHVANEFLYVAGTKGYRKPYSLTHAKINRFGFLRSQRNLLFKSFPKRTAILLYLIVLAWTALNKWQLRGF